MRRARRLREDVGRNSLHEITTYLSEIESLCSEYRNSYVLRSGIGQILNNEVPVDPATIKGITMTLQNIEEELKGIYESMYDIGPDLIGELEIILDSIDGRY